MGNHVRVDLVADVCLETPGVSRNDEEVVTITGLHDPHAIGCREVVWGWNKSGEAVCVMVVQAVQPSCLAGKR